MTKMTAAEAIAWLTSDKAFGQECYSRKQIAALLEQQAATIEAMKCCENCRHSYTDFGQNSPCGECNLGRVNVQGSKWELVGK